MANAVPSRLGQVNATGDTLALFRDVFSGEVLTAFETSVTFADKQMTRNISEGKSASFPMTWKIGSEYHVPGAEINGSPVKHNEKVITIDALLIAHAFVANIDEAMNHYEVRSVYATEMGRQLAKTYDKNSFRSIVAAARGTHPIDTAFNGSSITDAALATSGSTIASSIFAAVELLDSKDVPDVDRYSVLDIASYYLLTQNTNVLNKDWGGAGSYADADVPKVAGVGIFKTNNLPKDAGDGVFHTTDTTNSVGVVYQRGAAGCVKLLDMSMESEYQIQRQGTLMVAKNAVGHGPLRTECAVELKTA